MEPNLLENQITNYVAGSQNRWKYDRIITYGFYPSEEFPVICYFKETETPEWKWDRRGILKQLMYF
jgi:hypothetical protein